MSFFWKASSKARTGATSGTAFPLALKTRQAVCFLLPRRQWTPTTDSSILPACVHIGTPFLRRPSILSPGRWRGRPPRPHRSAGATCWRLCDWCARWAGHPASRCRQPFLTASGCSPSRPAQMSCRCNLGEHDATTDSAQVYHRRSSPHRHRCSWAMDTRRFASASASPHRGMVRPESWAPGLTGARAGSSGSQSSPR